MGHGFCEEGRKAHNEFKQCEKMYVNPDQVSIEPNGIFVNVQEKWFMAEALYADTNGIYFTSASSSDWSIYWKCPYCGYINGPLDNRCQNKDCPSRKKSKD